MRVRAFIDQYDVSGAITVDSVSIEQDSTQAISTANAGFIQVYGEARYDHAQYNHAAFRYEWTAQEWGQFVVSDQDTGQLLFAGFILSVQRKAEGPHIRVELQASDWGILFERAIMTQVWPAGTLDSTIISDCLAQVPQLRAGTIVPQVENIGEFAVKDQRVRDVLDAVCALTGGEWAVSYDGKLNYYRSGSIAAPFILCDQPDNPNDEPYTLEDYQSDFSDAANRVLVLGAIDDISEVRETAEDMSSQQRYGVLSVTLVNRDIFDPTTAQLFAQSEVQQRAWPKTTIRASFYRPGMARGMTVQIEAIKYGISATLLLRTLTLSIAAPDRKRLPVSGHVVKYTATLGPRPPDLVYTLRRMQRDVPESTFAPTADVPPGSIDAGDLASNLEVVHVVDVLPVPPPADWSQTAFAVIASDPFHKLYRRTGDTWTLVVDAESIQGQLKTTQFAPGSVTSTVLADGSVVTAKIPAGAITAPQLGPGAVTAPALGPGAVTGPAIAASSIEAGKLAAGAVTAGTIAAGAVTANTLAAGAITATAISAGAITATALAAGSVTANAIAANAIYAEAMQANSVTTQALAANSVVAGKIAALAVVAGNLAADSVTAGVISAGAVRAGNLAADAVTAFTIAAGSVTVGKIGPGAVTQGTLAAEAVVAGNIQAGSIDSTKLNAIEIAVGAGGGKPGKIGVYDGALSKVAVIGNLSDAGKSGFGLWAKVGAFGGTGYFNAPFYTDDSGSLFLKDANLTITGGGSTLKTSPTTFDPTYATLALINQSGSDQASFVSRGFIVYSGSTSIGALVRHPSIAGSAQLALVVPGGKLILLDGATGIVRSDNGFGAGGANGVSEAVTIGGVTLRFNGGIYVGH